ncbi:MAG: hypothetical protein KAS73_10030 [Candidatus Sabulitectum sp.]|nr:hypothetical protein [Candidatus Sabulitectum sp.]
MIRIILLSLVISGVMFSDQLLLGNQRFDCEVYDACTSIQGNCGVATGVMKGEISSVYLVKVNSTPTIEWETTSNFSNGADEYGFGICALSVPLPICPTAEYAVCGYVDNPLNHGIPSIYLFDGEGNLITCMVYDSYIEGCFKSVIQMRNGGLALLGESEVEGIDRIFVMALDRRLEHVWHNVYTSTSGSAYTYPNCLLQTDPTVGDYLIALVTPIAADGTYASVVCFDNDNMGTITDYVSTC